MGNYKANAVFILAAVLVCLVAGTVAYSATTILLTINNTASIESNIGVYFDSACTQRATSINWGTLTVDSSKTISLYLRNTASYPVSLSMATYGWFPSEAQQHLTLTWNLQGATAQPNQTYQADFTLTANTYGNYTAFRFDIQITASQLGE